MAATPITPFPASSPYGSALASGAEVAANPADGNSFVNDGRSYLVARNDGEASHSVTIRGKSFAVGVGKSVVLGPFPTFEQFGESVTATADDASVFLLVVSIPDDLSAKR
jgi:hypothetical protein